MFITKLNWPFAHNPRPRQNRSPPEKAKPHRCRIHIQRHTQPVYVSVCVFVCVCKYVCGGQNSCVSMSVSGKARTQTHKHMHSHRDPHAHTLTRRFVCHVSVCAYARQTSRSVSDCNREREHAGNHGIKCNARARQRRGTEIASVGLAHMELAAPSAIHNLVAAPSFLRSIVVT